MDGEGRRSGRRRRIDGTILFGGILSALLHAVGIALLLMAPTRLQPIVRTAYTVEVVDPDALGGELLAGPIGGAVSDEPEPKPAPEQEPKPEPEKVPVAPPEPEEPERRAKAEPSAPEADAVPVSPTVRPTPRAKPTAKATARPKPKPTATKIVKAAKRTPARKPAPKQVAAAKKPTKPAAKPAKPVVKPAKPAAKPGKSTGGAARDLDSELSAAIAGLKPGLGGTATSQTGPPGVGGEGPGGGGTVRGIEFVAYYSHMLARIKDRWTWAGERADLRVTVRFSILPSGGIANLRLIERSGEATYDASVQRAIKSASPFAPPPAAYQRDFADVELTFRPADLEVSG